MNCDKSLLVSCGVVMLAIILCCFKIILYFFKEMMYTN